MYICICRLRCRKKKTIARVQAPKLPKANRSQSIETTTAILCALHSAFNESPKKIFHSLLYLRMFKKKLYLSFRGDPMPKQREKIS